MAPVFLENIYNFENSAMTSHWRRRSEMRSTADASEGTRQNHVYSTSSSKTAQNTRAQRLLQ